MEKILLEETSNTPYVLFDFDNGLIEMKGRSIPEDSISFYQPLMEAMDAYVSNPKPVTNINVQLEYFSTSSSKCILDLFKKLEKIIKSGKTATINWYYEEQDEDMREAGVDYEAIIEVPFKIIQVDEPIE